MRLGKAFLRFCTDRYQLFLSGSSVALEQPFTVCIVDVLLTFLFALSYQKQQQTRPRCGEQIEEWNEMMRQGCLRCS